MKSPATTPEPAPVRTDSPAKDDPYEHGICLSCFSKWCTMEPGSPAFIRFGQRLRRNAVNHPTYKALCATLDAMESTPHGALVEGSR